MSDYSVGQKIGDYEILGTLGAGGMGKVYKVRNTISDRVEAMKILLPDLAGQKDLADRFLREIKVLASLSHPNIAALRTALTLDNQLVMIMEFVDGVTLSSRITNGPLPPGLAIKYIDQVLAALSYAHKQNVIHRDIKPANMMITSDGVVKLMDFGIARSSTDRSLTVTGTTLGSLNYMPPEQVKGDPADNRSDLYSLGVSLYELVTGQLPFQADSNYAMMAAHLQEAPKPPIVLRPDIPQQLNQIILMALAKDPDERFQSADAFRGALKHVAIPSEGTTLPAVAPRAAVPSAADDGATALFQETPSTPSPAMRAASPAYQRTQPMQTPAPVAAAQPGMPAVPPPVASSGGHRGLYIALGAFIVLAVLFVAGLYVPRWAKTLAGHRAQQQPAATSSANPASSNATASPSDASTAPSTPADASAAAPAGSSPASAAPANGTVAQSPSTPAAPQPPSAPATTPSTANASPNSAPDVSPAAAADTNAAPPPKKSHANRAKRSAPSAQSASDAQSASTDTVPPPQDAALAQEVEQKSDDLDSRASAAAQTLDTLKRQQAAAGYGLRGDIVSAQARMNTDLAKAQAARQNNDLKSAKKYLDMAEAELQTIEKFLGH